MGEGAGVLDLQLPLGESIRKPLVGASLSWAICYLWPTASRNRDLCFILLSPLKSPMPSCLTVSGYSPPQTHASVWNTPPTPFTPNKWECPLDAGSGLPVQVCCSTISKNVPKGSSSHSFPGKSFSYIRLHLPLCGPPIPPLCHQNRGHL